MEDHLNCILDCPYLFQEKNIEELKHSLWSTTMELEANRIRVQEQIKARDAQLTQLKHLLNNAVSERNEARNNYQSLLLDKLLLQHQLHHQTTTALPHSSVSCVEDDPISEESIENPVQVPQVPTKGLPENGKFLEAVMNAGPLLQNLLLAGSLPNWRQPPPPLDGLQIPSPPLVVPTRPAHHLLSQDYLHNVSSNCLFKKKRGISEDTVSSTNTKYQRISLNYDK
ncbi:hypothetical protein HanXRQr2_Chr07g0305871 [Helianthus annuus]|uniref:Uncharacterized protein n=1 Tax=Helianthus annuus TaxID=4232 RepID=A0A251UBZ7_HELAN|nr:arp2/3 complex-activating protein rickA [Helianthus annuus]KAF5799559.1 hypothetical protein HanXRQr2_Chr07g0305871 [Helianthus annuus]